MPRRNPSPITVPVPAWLDRWLAGSLPVRETAAEKVAVPSGKIAACDPLAVLEEPPAALSRAVPAGRHAVTLGTVDGEVAFASVRFGRAKVVRWEHAAGYRARSGSGCFADASALGAFVARERKRHERITAALRKQGLTPSDAEWHTAFETRLAEGNKGPLAELKPLLERRQAASAVLDADSGASLVAFRGAATDGYASYWGLDAKGRPMLLVTDAGVLDREEEDESLDDEDEPEALEDDDEDEGDLDGLGDLEVLRALFARAKPATERPPAVSPLLPRAEAILERWVSSGKMELEEDCDRRALAESLLEKLVALDGHRHVGSHLAEWLMERPEVADVFASDDELEEDLRG